MLFYNIYLKLMKRFYLLILFSLTFFCQDFTPKISAQNFELQFDVKQTPQFDIINQKQWTVSDYYEGKYDFLSNNNNSIITEKWEAFNVFTLLEEEWDLKIDFMSSIKYLHSVKKYLVYSQNNFSLINNEGKKEFNYKLTNKESKITSIYFSEIKQNIFWVEVQLQNDCNKSSWQIMKYDGSNNEISKITEDTDINFTNISQKNTPAKCPYITDVKISPNNENILFRYTNIEYDNFCIDLYLYNNNKFTNIINRCDNSYKDADFLDDNSIIIITSNNYTNNIMLQIVNQNGTKISSTGCYDKKGIEGNFIDFELDFDKQSFFLYFEKEDKYFVNKYKITGELIETKEVGSYYKINYQENIYLSAFDYNIFNARDVNTNELFGFIFHDYDIFDFVIINNTIVSVDEAGIMKKWNINTKNNHLLVLENSQQITQIPVNLSDFSIETNELSAIGGDNYTLFSERQIVFERERQIIERDYLKFFNLNNITHEGIYTDKDNHLSSFVQFSINANMYYYPVRVFHISKSENNFTFIPYCGRCINYFGYSKNAENYLIAILPDSQIGYLDNEKLFELDFSSSNSLIEIELDILPVTETENILKQILSE